MPSRLSPFSQWALDDARTADERFLSYLVCEACRFVEYTRLPLEVRRQVPYRSLPFQHWKEYYLNPLLMPEFGVAETERAAAMTPWFKEFKAESYHDNRRLGEAGAVLGFFPALEHVSLGATSMTDLSFLERLPNLHTFKLSSAVLEDLEPLGRCPSLRHLTLHLSTPGPPLFTPPLYWVDARPLEALTRLESLTLSPNATLLSGLRFPALKRAAFESSHCVQPDCGHLPDMPALRELKLDGIQSLRGIGRFPDLGLLHLGGPLRDFADIAGLRQLKCLVVETLEGWPRDVSALAALPSLVWVRFAGELPRNYWPLAQAPRLCELAVDKVPSVHLEVQAINAALAPWDSAFAAPEARPLPPLRFVLAEPGGDRSSFPAQSQEPEPDFLDNPKLFHLELRWMHDRAVAAVRKLLGDEHSVAGNPPFDGCPLRSVTIQLVTLEAAARLPAVLDALRGAMADSPHSWLFQVCLCLKLRERDMTEQQKKWLRQIEERSRNWEDDDRLERFVKTRDHVIETQFRLRVSREENEEPDPEDFVPPEEIRPRSYPAVPVPASGGAGDDEGDEDETADEDGNPDFALKPFDEQEQNPSDGDNDGGEVATAPPPEPPDSFWNDPFEHPLADSYRFYATLDYEGFFHCGHNNATVVQLMGREPDVYFPAPTVE